MAIRSSSHASSRELRLTVQCLELYYRQAQPEGHRQGPGRVGGRPSPDCSSARSTMGFVRVELDLPRTEQLEAALAQKFGLRDAVVIASGGRGDVKEELGAAAAAYFEKIAAQRHAHRPLVRVHPLPDHPRAARAALPRSCPLSPVRREHAQARGPLPEHAGRDDGGQVPPARAGLRPARPAPALAARDRARAAAPPARPRDPSIFEAAQAVDIALAGIGLIGEDTPGFCALAESYGVSVKRLRQLGVVGEINYQPFDADGRIVDRTELRALMHRVLSVDGGAAAGPLAAGRPPRDRGGRRAGQGRGGPRRAARPLHERAGDRRGLRQRACWRAEAASGLSGVGTDASSNAPSRRNFS